MSRQAIARARPRRAASLKRTVHVDPPARALGKAVEAGFRDAAAQAVAEAHRAGVPVAIATDDGGVAWLYPNGTVRAPGP
jgi:imidazolonepropionase-like amidohydrolase